MRYLSLFSGIEAATVAWRPLGWECAAVAEIEPGPCAVLAHHYPGVRNLGDVTKVTPEDIAALGGIDLVVFGSPCQDLSVAGKRKGLEGERSGLFFTAMRIIGWARELCGCRFALWENVPGAFSSNAGRDFAAVVAHMAGLAECAVPPKGWGVEGCAVGEEGMVEWSTLDAQWFGVAQRRRRVFALADFGNWPGRPPILLEPEGLRGDSAPSREAGDEVAGTVFGGASMGGTGPAGRTDCAATGYLRPVVENAFGDVARCLTVKSGGGLDAETADFIVTNQVAGALGANHGNIKAEHAWTGQLIAYLSGTQCASAENLSPSLGAKNPTAIAIQAGALRENQNSGPDGVGVQEHIAYTLEARAEVQAVAYPSDVAPTLDCRASNGPVQQQAVSIVSGMQVRRLTPVECERLQGFPDNYTLVPHRGKPMADGPRYKALGNSMAVPVMNWIGCQIELALFMEKAL